MFEELDSMLDLSPDSDLSRLSMRTYDEEGKIITKWDEEKGWFENGTEQNEYGEWIMNRIYHPYTEEELKEIQLKKEEAELIESRRQLTLEEAIAIFMKNNLNMVDIPNQTSLRMLNYYPSFEEIIGQTVKMGFKFMYVDKMYKTIQDNLTIQEQYPPGKGTESLYSRIDVEHAGKVYDPIPYEGNMELKNGKYYSQYDVLYLCIRNTEKSVYHDLKDLVGLYVEVNN